MSRKLENMRPFLTAEEIHGLVKGLARQIEADYAGQDVTLICPLKGSVLFCADLCRELQLPQRIDFVQLVSPRGQSVRVIQDISIDIRNQNVLIVEEIIDAGRTLSFLRDRLLLSLPRRLKIVTLLDKPARREHPVTPDYTGLTGEDRFVVGYGMDSEEYGRNYSDIFNYTQ